MGDLVTIENVEVVTLSLLAIGFIILLLGLYWVGHRKNKTSQK